MWQLNNDLAGNYQAGPYNLTVNLRRPEDGLQLTYAGTRCSGLWLGAVTPGRAAGENGSPPPEAVTESYVRGRDLIATYAQGLTRTARPQIYWRVSDFEQPAQALAIELVLSVQSSKLESQPQFPVNTTVPLGDDSFDVQVQPLKWSRQTSDPRLQKTSPAMYMWKMADAPLWAAVMPHPGDNAKVVSGSNAFSGAFELSISLFPRSVEKGVIRRSRIQMLLAGGDLPQDDAASFFASSFEDWTSSAPPLTV